jgi:hypothetical protein
MRIARSLTGRTDQRKTSNVGELYIKPGETRRRQVIRVVFDGRVTELDQLRRHCSFSFNAFLPIDQSPGESQPRPTPDHSKRGVQDQVAEGWSTPR